MSGNVRPNDRTKDSVCITEKRQRLSLAGPSVGEIGSLVEFTIASIMASR